MRLLNRIGAADTTFHALQLMVERTGCAWACPFASSDEYEASVIRAKRAAGAYGPKRQRRQMLVAAALGALLAIFFASFI